MNVDNILLGKRVLIADDEQDVLETLFELLENCKLDMASSYEQAYEMLEKNPYDLAILDIMGVDGKKANQQKVPAIMLTANALSAEDLAKSAELGAAYYAPKEELANIKSIAAEVIHAIENKKSPWEKMFIRLADFYDKRFNGPDWREQRKQFWDEKRKNFSPYWH